LSQHDLSDLHSVYNKELFEFNSLNQSKEFIERCQSDLGPTSLFIEVSPVAPSLPIRKDWLFLPIEHLVTKWRRDGPGSIKESFSKIVISVLKLIQNLENETACISELVDPGIKLLHFQTLFLLPDPDCGELFLCDQVQNILDWGFKKWAHLVPDLDMCCGSKARYYHLYLELLRQYQSSSFFNRVFSQYISIPLAMSYPPDYRLAFWSNMIDTAHIFPLKIGDAYLPLESFTAPKETQKNVLNYQKTLVKKAQYFSSIH
jgi:hypothetical protein